MSEPLNNRVLVIDDEEAIRASFAEILAPRQRSQSKLSDLRQQLFGEEDTAVSGNSVFDFEVHLAAGGEDGLRQFTEAHRSGKPFAVVFVDVRMPGMDGLETVQELRKIDGRAEVIFITAYSDYEIEEIVRRAGVNVGYHTKPFAPEEIRQLATKAVYEWNKNLSLEELISIVSELRTTERELNLLLKNILHQVAELLGSTSALIATRNDAGYEQRIGMGLLSDRARAEELLHRLPQDPQTQVFHDREAIFYGMSRFGVVALFEGDSGVLTNHRIYLARLFLEEAAQAIRNAELREELLRKEKLSAVGQGVSMVAHDLRSPLGNVLSLVDLLEDEGGLPESAGELVSLIRSSAQTATTIVNDILDFARGGGIEKSETDAREIVARVEQESRRMVEEMDVALEAEVESGLQLSCDLTKLSRALVNLIRNSAEALSRTVGGGRARISLRAFGSPEGVGFEVSDNGPGLPEHVRENLFIPFVSPENRDGDSRAERTGLGLAIVKKFVDLHDGTIDVETNGSGTTFTIGIPR